MPHRWLDLETDPSAGELLSQFGDVRSGSAKRVATAVGEGAMAIRLAYERLRAS